jgi:two-component sensor histidine kinase
MKKTILLLIISCTLLLHINAQTDCNCPDFIKLREQKRNTGVFNHDEAILKLQGNKFSGCTPRYNEWLAEKMITKKDFDSAKYFLQIAFDYYKNTGCNDEVYSNYYKLLATIHHHLGEYANSAELCYKLLPITEITGDKYDKANCLLLLSNSFNRMKQSVKGIEYARLAAPEIEQLIQPYEKAALLFELSARYLWYYQDTENKTYIDTAEYYTRAQLEIGRKEGFTDIIGNGYNKMNGYAHERNDFVTALKYVDSSIYLFEKVGNRTQIATSYGDKADILMEMKNYKEARRYADSCLSLNLQNKNPELIANSYALIYQISNSSENYKDAVWAMNEYLTINDSLIAVEKSNKINELEKKYSQAKNENKIKDLDKKKQLYFFLAIAGLLAALAIAFFLRQQSLKHKKNILETEQRLNRARMNPHFFFNALTTLQKFALRDNDGQAMASNLSKFSNIMRETLESTYKEYITIEQEMEFLNEYLEVQKIRFPQTFSYEVNADKNLDIDELQIPAMIIQPFVENSIEHGFVGVDYPGKVTVDFTSENKELMIQINDNGKGLNTTAKENNEHISRASQIIKDRIYLLNIKLKTKAGFSIDNNSTGNGVIVKIHLPLLYKEQKTS